MVAASTTTTPAMTLKEMGQYFSAFKTGARVSFENILDSTEDGRSIGTITRGPFNHKLQQGYIVQWEDAYDQESMESFVLRSDLALVNPKGAAAVALATASKRKRKRAEEAEGESDDNVHGQMEPNLNKCPRSALDPPPSTPTNHDLAHQAQTTRSQAN